MFLQGFDIISSIVKYFLHLTLTSLLIQARIAFFRRLKSLLKKFAGKYSFHNFATGGATPEESAAVRKLDRMYHKDLLVSEGKKCFVIFVV